MNPNDPITSLIPVYLFLFIVAALVFVRLKTWWEDRQLRVRGVQGVEELSEITWGKESEPLKGTYVEASVPFSGISLEYETPKELDPEPPVRKLLAPRHALVPALVVEDPRIDPNFRWLCRDALHALVAGFTGSGKTSLVRGILIASSQLGKIFVIDTHGNEAKWGIPRSAIRGVGSNFDDAIAAFLEVENERIRRYEEFSHVKPGENIEFPRLTVIVEEFPELVAKAKDRKINLASMMMTLVQGGREVNMHIVSVAQDTNAATMGVTGRAKSLRNMTQVVLGVQAAEKLGKTFVEGEYLAAIQRNGISWSELDISFIPTLIRKPIQITSIWQEEHNEEFTIPTDEDRAALLRELAPTATASDIAFILFGSTADPEYQRALTLGAGAS